MLFRSVSYTLARTRTSGSDFVQTEAEANDTSASGLISPYEQDRNDALAADDATHVLSAALVWDLPFGKGRRWVNQDGLANVLLGGWQLSTVFRYSSALPFFFRSSYCNVPGQFRAGCIPSSTGDVFAQDKGSFDPNAGPLFNLNAFEPSDAFNFYYGRGPRVSEFRGFSYRNQDLALIKNTRQIGRASCRERVL